jgi:hypothetical protein
MSIGCINQIQFIYTHTHTHTQIVLVHKYSEII